MPRGRWLLCLALGAARPAMATPPRPFPLPRAPVEDAGALLGSRDSEEVRLGLSRLGALGTPRALELLIRALGAGAAAGGVERLVAVHALAPHAGQPEVRAALVRVLRHPAADPGATRARTAAALALAREGGAEALSALLGALGQGGEVEAAALEGLQAFPPRTVPLTAVPAPGSAATLRALAALGDPRLLETFRAAVRGGDAEARAVAALALASLGDGGVQALVPAWSQSAAPALRVTAHELAWRAGRPLDGARLAALVREPGTRERALALALRAPGPALALALEDALGREASPARRVEVALALARAGAPGLAALERALARPGPAAALEALARTPGAPVRAALTRALAAPAPGRATRAARAATLHRRLHGDEVPGRAAALAALARSPEAAARTTVAWCAAVLDPAPALARLERERDPSLRAALSVALLDAGARARASRELLEALMEAPAPAPCLAAWALAERAPGPASWLVEGPRAARLECVAAGLAANLADPPPGGGAPTLARVAGVVAAAEQRWLTEPEPHVRRALVAVVAARRGPARDGLLARMAALDPAASVRSAARWAASAPGADPGAHGVAAELGARLLAQALDPEPAPGSRSELPEGAERGSGRLGPEPGQDARAPLSFHGAAPAAGRVGSAGTAPHQPPATPGREALTMLDSEAW